MPFWSVIITERVADFERTASMKRNILSSSLNPRRATVSLNASKSPLFMVRDNSVAGVTLEIDVERIIAIFSLAVLYYKHASQIKVVDNY